MRNIITFLLYFPCPLTGQLHLRFKSILQTLKANDAVHSVFIKNDEQGFKMVWDGFERPCLKLVR